MDLCREPDGGRRVRLKLADNPAKLRQIGERIAALLLVCNRSSVYLGQAGTGEVSDLEVADIAGGEETVGDVPIEATENLVRETVRMPLFTAGIDERARFPHQTYAESLASDYLKDLQMPQLSSLLCNTDGYGDYVEPPLCQLASWIAGEVPAFFDLLLGIDPDTLLRADMAHLPIQQKRRLLEAVLQRADVEKLFHDYGTHRHYAGLAFPGIAQVLRPYIIGNRRNDEVRRIALGIARECQLRGLLPDLLRVLRDPSDASFHSHVAFTLFAFIRPVNRRQVEPLVRPGSGVSPRARFGIVTSLVRSGVWSMSQALPLVEGLLNADQFNHSHTLANFATPRDTAPILQAVLRWPGAFDGLSQYHGFVTKAYDLGLPQLLDPKIRRLFARAWLAGHGNGQFHGTNFPSLDQALKTEPSIRRAFLTELIVMQRGQDSAEWYHFTAVADKVGDFEYFLRQLPSTPRTRQDAYACFLAALYDPERHAPFFDLLLERIAQIPVLRAKFAWLREWKLDDPVTVDTRRRHRENEELKASWAAQRGPKSDPAPVWAAAIEEAKKETNEGWFHVAQNFFFGRSGNDNGSGNEFDLTTSVGWAAQGLDGQTIARKSARAFLIRQPGDSHVAKGKTSNWTVFAYRALFLLRNEIESDSDLRDAVKAHWLPLFYLDFLGNDSVRKEMATLACRLDPKSKNTALRHALLQRLGDENSYVFELRHLQPVWDKSLSLQLTRFVRTRRVPAEMIDSVMEFLREVDSSAGAVLANRLLARRDLSRPVSVSLWAWLLQVHLVATWPTAVSQFKRRRKLASSVLWRIATSFRDMKWPATGPGVASVVAQFYDWLCLIFPYRSDPPIPGGIHSPTPRMDAARFRSEALSILVGLGTEEACQEMAKIANASGPKQRNWMQSYFQNALVAMRQRQWQAHRPEVVIDLALNSHRRFLRSDADLARLVLESLARLEDSLQRDRDSAISDYWAGLATGPKGIRLKGEIDSARRIVNWLRHDLAKDKGIIIFREVSIQWNERTDIEVVAGAIRGRKLHPLSVTIEVKGAWNRDVTTAAATQLAKRYLIGTGRRTGIYLVLWIHCKASTGQPCRLNARNLNAARKEVTDLVASAQVAFPTLNLEPAVLDLALPDSYLASARNRKKNAAQTQLTLALPAVT